MVDATYLGVAILMVAAAIGGIVAELQGHELGKLIPTVPDPLGTRDRIAAAAGLDRTGHTGDAGRAIGAAE